MKMQKDKMFHKKKPFNFSKRNSTKPKLLSKNSKIRMKVKRK